MLWGSCMLEIGDGIVFLQSMSPLRCGLQKPSILPTSQRTRFDLGFSGLSGMWRRREAFCKSTGIRTLDRDTNLPSQVGKEGWCACWAVSGLPLALVVDAPLAKPAGPPRMLTTGMQPDGFTFRVPKMKEEEPHQWLRVLTRALSWDLRRREPFWRVAWALVLPLSQVHTCTRSPEMNIRKSTRIRRSGTHQTQKWHQVSSSVRLCRVTEVWDSDLSPKEALPWEIWGYWFLLVNWKPLFEWKKNSLLLGKSTP